MSSNNVSRIKVQYVYLLATRLLKIQKRERPCLLVVSARANFLTGDSLTSIKTLQEIKNSFEWAK